MLLRPFLNDAGSCASYLFGCTSGNSLAVAAGSDGHLPWEIGGTYSLMPAFSNAAELRTAARSATIPEGLRTRAYVHAFSMGLMLVRRRRRHAGERYDLAPA